MLLEAHEVQSKVKEAVLPDDVLKFIVSHLTDGLQMLETKTASTIDWLGSFSKEKLSDIPLDISSYKQNGQIYIQFDHRIENAVRIIPKNGLTSSETGIRIPTQQFQQQFQGLRESSLSEHLKHLEDTKDQLLKADTSLDDASASITTERTTAVHSITKDLQDKWIKLFTETRWYPIIHGQFACISDATAPAPFGGRDATAPVPFSPINDKTDWVKLALECVLHIDNFGEDGHILVFLAGKDEIDNAIKALEKVIEEEKPRHNRLMGFRLYRRLHTDRRGAACIVGSDPESVGEESQERSKRKVIFATDIATTSELVDGIRYVVDSGRTKRPRFDPIYEAIYLRPEAIAKDMLQSRQACSKRREPGVFYHLYSNHDLQNLPEDIPTDLETRRFTPMLADGIRTGKSCREVLDMYDLKDSSSLVQHAIKELRDIGYLDSNQCLTEYGARLNRYPCDPSHAHFLECCRRRSCFKDGLKLVGMLSADEIFKYVAGKRLLPSARYEDSEDEPTWDERRSNFHSDGDHLTLLKFYKLYWEENGAGLGQTSFCRHNHLSETGLNKAIETYRRCFAAICDASEDLEVSTNEGLLKCLLEAYPNQLACHKSSTNRNGRTRPKERQKYTLHRLRHLIKTESVEIAHESALGRFSSKSSSVEFPKVILCGQVRWLRDRLYVFQASDVTSLVGSLPAHPPPADDHKATDDV